MNYIDLHCDTLQKCFAKGYEDMYELPELSVDFKRMAKGDCMAQFFAIYFPEASRFPGGVSDADYFKSAYDNLMTNLDRYESMIVFARNLSELESNRKSGRMSAFLTLEDGRLIGGSIENLERMADLGIRLISLTWNFANCFGYPNSKEPELMGLGLTDFGKEALEVMNYRGILIDVSHLSDGGFWDVVQGSKVPFVASHSNCREITRHPRNLTDEMLKALANHGGVAGLNYCPWFLNEAAQKAPTPAEAYSRVEDMIRHLKHMIHVGGEECMALGGDLDGIGGDLDIAGSDQVEKLFTALEHEGFTKTQIEKLAYKNVLRVIGDTMK